MGFLSRLLGETKRDLVADLAEDYRAEVIQAAHLREHAARARYPQAAEALTRLAAIEDRHATALRDRLRLLGAAVPKVDVPPLERSSQWARVVAAHHAAQQKRRRLVEQIGHWDPDEPEVVSLLRRIAQEDQEQAAVYEHLIMRSDPQALD
jgi:hypothetical protein